MSRFCQFVGVALIGAALAPSGEAAASSGKAASVDFQKEIRPIFESRCYECHGPNKQKSGLRLDRKENAFRGGDSGKAALLPGKSSESGLIQRVTNKDADEVMPPKGEKLTAAQIELLKDWIDQGALWPEDTSRKHWAYIAPVHPPLP